MEIHLQKNKTALYLFIILTITFFSFYSSINNDFTNWDDESHLLKNADVLSLNLESFKEHWKNMVNNTYIPLTTLSFALEYHFFGFNPFVYHLDNLILHLAVTALIFVFASRMGLSLLASSIAALLFWHSPHSCGVRRMGHREKGCLICCFLYAGFNQLCSIC